MLANDLQVSCLLFAASLLSSVLLPFGLLKLHRLSLQTCVMLNYTISCATNFLMMLCKPNLPVFALYCAAVKVDAVNSSKKN